MMRINKETLSFHYTELRGAAGCDYDPQALIDWVKALSMTGVDIILQHRALRRMRQVLSEFRKKDTQND